MSATFISFQISKLPFASCKCSPVEPPLVTESIEARKLIMGEKYPNLSGDNLSWL